MSLDDPTMECFVMEDDHEPKPWFSKAAIHDEYNMMRPIMFVVVCVKIIKACYGPFFFLRRCGAVMLNPISNRIAPYDFSYIKTSPQGTVFPIT